MALRRLRRFAREGAADELDLDGTIDKTARNAGYLDLQLRPERHNAVKVLLLLDIGGSMDEHSRLCSELFSAARSEFKHLEFFYFHNCVYDFVWNDNRRRHGERTSTWDLMHKFNADYRLIFVGDATMSPYEITYPGGSVEHFRKLMERDPVRAAQEIREVNDVARDALAQVRSAVTGYRASGLSAEFEAMKKAFDTAGVALSVEAEPLTLPPTHENALALILREASTNVLRHANAKTCRVRLAHRNNVALLEIVDDGTGGDGREGNGLTGMRERIAALGGSLVRDGRSGTRIEITLPLAPEPA